MTCGEATRGVLRLQLANAGLAGDLPLSLSALLDSPYVTSCQLQGNAFNCPGDAAALAVWRQAERRCGVSCRVDAKQYPAPSVRVLSDKRGADDQGQ